MTAIEGLMYRKCMRLAADYADGKAKSLGRSLDGRSLVIENTWTSLWNAYGRKKASEEDVKACFLLGYVTEEFLGVTWDGAPQKTGIMPKNPLTRKKKILWK